MKLLLKPTFYIPLQTTNSDPPTLIQGGNAEYNVMRDEILALSCYMDSYPPPVITWEKDGHPISPNSPNYIIQLHSLGIPRARVSDTGLYVCIASNEVGTVNHTMRVNVQGECI